MRRPRTSPDPVGLAVVLALLSFAMLLIFCGWRLSDASCGYALMDLVGLGFALFALACLRWVWQALKRYRTYYDNFKPSHHP